MEIGTAAATVLIGVVIFCITKILELFFIEPIFEQKKVIGEIADSLIYYANVIANPRPIGDERGQEAGKKLRQLATLLQSKTYMIPAYDLFASINAVRSKENIKETSSELILLSNSTVRPDQDNSDLIKMNEQSKEKIKKYLNIVF